MLCISLVSLDCLEFSNLNQNLGSGKRLRFENGGDERALSHHDDYFTRCDSQVEPPIKCAATGCPAKLPDTLCVPWQIGKTLDEKKQTVAK